jgi:hypothetical protein
MKYAPLLFGLMVGAGCPEPIPETDVAFSVMAGENFVHDEGVEAQMEGTQLGTVEAPEGVRIQMEWPEEIDGPVIRFEGRLPSGQHAASVLLEHYQDGPSHYERWNVTISAK